MSSSNLSKSAQISALVQALRAGQLTKEQLFTELHHLQRNNEAAPTVEQPAAAPTVPAEAVPVAQPQHYESARPVSSSRADTASAHSFSSARQARSVTTPQTQEDHEPIAAPHRIEVENDLSVAQPSALHAAYSQYLAVATQNSNSAKHAPPTAHTPAGNTSVPRYTGGDEAMQRGRSTANMVKGVLTAGASFRAPSAANVRTPQAAAPPTGPQHTAARVRSASTQSRYRGQQGAPANEEEEYPFKPAIKPLPAQYGSATRRVLASVPFQERTVAWAKHREEGLARLAAEAKNKELDGCTFRPQVNKTSKVLTEQRSSNLSYVGSEAHVDSASVHERLYRSKTPSKTPSYGSRRNDYGGSGHHGEDAGLSALSGRSRSQSSAVRYFTEGRPLFTSPNTGSPRTGQSVILRNGEVEYQPLTRTEEEELKECTFQPKVHTTYEARPVKSRYMAAARRASHGALPTSNHLPTGMDECTFKPKTNTVDPQSMPAAAMYVRAPIFDRLARTHTQAQRERETGVSGDRSRSPDSTGNQSDDNSSKGHHTTASAEERRRKHAEFLARQEAAERKRQQKLEAIASELAPVGRPELCAKSLYMAENSRQGSFLERVANETARKEHEILKSKARTARDPECTFQPKINPASKNLRGRSIVELSRGDQLKRETAMRLMRLRAEAEQLEGVTFAPAINEKSKRVSSRLRVAEDPDTYVMRLKAEAEHAALKARQLVEEQAQQELRECTFKPAIHDAPEYVKRIARSMALARAVKPPEVPAKPDWR